LLGVIVLAAVGGAAAHNGISLTGSGTPVVDGVISPGEWDAAGSVSFTATVAGGPSVPGTLRVMNDATNLYLGVSVREPVLGSTAFRFDNNHDGSGIEQGDDNLAIGFGVSPPGANKLADGTYSRLPPCPAGFTCGFQDTELGGTTDGFGAFHVSGDEVDYEISHPLDSADNAHDFSLHAGSVVGVLFQVVTRNALGASSITQPFGSTVLSDIVIQPPDTTPPTISCGSPDGLWHSDDVSIACSASDAASGLANASDATFSLSTHVADGTQTASASTDSLTVCDKAGNCSTAGPIEGNKVDKEAPTLSATFAAEDGSTYVPGSWTNQAVTVTYQCGDGDGSGVASSSPATTLSTEGTDQSATGGCTDNVGHTTTRTFGGIDIDLTPPEAYAVFDPATDDLLVYATDTGGSGVPTGPVTPGSAGKDERGYEIVDGAGNSLSLTLFVDTTHSTVDARIDSLSYNHDPVIDAPDNHISDAFHNDNDGSLRAVTQEVSVGKGHEAVHVAADYDRKLDQTTIDVAGGGGSTRPGLVLLRLETDQGGLDVEYP
jgi:hypothetical protein